MKITDEQKLTALVEKYKNDFKAFATDVLVLMFLGGTIYGCSPDTLFNPADTVPDFANVEEVVQYMTTHDPFEHCIHSANIAQICCDKIGYNTMKVDLWRGGAKDVKHQICIAWNKSNEWHFFTGRTHRLIIATGWQDYVMNDYYSGWYRKAVISNEHNQGEVE